VTSDTTAPLQKMGGSGGEYDAISIPPLCPIKLNLFQIVFQHESGFISTCPVGHSILLPVLVTSAHH